MTETTAPVLTARQLLDSIKNQARRAVYDERDDSKHFEQFHWVKDEAIRQRILVERAIIRRAVRDILAADGGAYCISVYDGEEYPVKRSRDLDTIMADIGQCDQEWLYVRTGAKGETKVGGVMLVYGNDGWDVICDYSTGHIETLLAGANKLADELGDIL